MGKRVYLLGYFYAGAWADDLIGMITAELVREAAGGDVEIRDARSHPHPRSGPKVAEFFNREADLVIFCGGSLLGRLRLPPFHAIETWIDKLRSPLVVLGTGWREETRELNTAEIERMGRLIEASRAIYLRGHYSFDRMADAGLPMEDVEVLGDPGLCFRATRARAHRGDRARVGVVVRNMSQVEIDQDPDTLANRSFHHNLAGVLDDVVDHYGGEIFWFPMTSRGRREDDDFAGSARVQKKMRAEGRYYYTMFDRPHHEPSLLARSLGLMDLVISQRLHGTLIALAQGVPVWPIEYQFAKCYDALSIEGLEHHRQLITRQTDIQPGTYERLRPAIFDRPAIAAAGTVCRALRDRYVEILSQLLEPSTAVVTQDAETSPGD